MEKDILDIITEYAVNEGIDETLLYDAEYVKIQDKIRDMSARFDKLDLTKEERLVVGRMIAAQVESGACYGRIAYKKGVRDCVDLLKAIDLIGTN